MAVERSCQESGFTLQTWVDEKAIKADYDRVKVGKQSLPLLPDAYFVIKTATGNIHFFLEFDRGTEGLTVFKRKIKAYLVYFRGGKCKARYGTNKIRVLTVSLARLVNLRGAAQKLGARRRFWFTLLPQVTSEDILVSPIWQAATGSDPNPLVSS